MKRSIENAQQIGSAIREVRRAQRVRQEDLAAAIGSSHRFLRELERGKATQIQRLFQTLSELGIRIYADAPGAVLRRTPRAEDDQKT